MSKFVKLNSPELLLSSSTPTAISPSSSSHYNLSSSSFNSNFNSTSPCNLTVTNLSYTVHQSTLIPLAFHCLPQDPHHAAKPKQILKAVSFVAKNSELLAIVGPSGTGKSTLLRSISGRVDAKHFDPNAISIDNRKIVHQTELRRICGFVAQEDNLLPMLTVKETLMFSAKFSIKGKVSSAEREEKVDRMIHELGLTHVENSYVGDGDETRGISGGERKRVSIGVDIINDPMILVLDEPTSGLDSTSALQVIELLASMAKEKNRLIVISIHQPSYRLLRCISSFLILYNGSVVHNGSIEALEDRIDKMGFEIPVQLNVLEFSMEILSTLEEDSCCTLKKTSSPGSLYEVEIGRIDDCYNTQRSEYLQDDNNRLSEVMSLCTRLWKILYRTKQLFLARTMQALVGGFGLASVFTNVRKQESGIAERLGLFAFTLSLLLSSTVEALPLYLQERRVIMKESSRGAYRISSYMIANAVVFSPFLLAVSIIFAAPLYWLVGLNPSASAFAFFTFTVWLIVLMASSLVLFLSAISPDFISGNSLICTILGAFFLFSGYFIPKENIPKYWMFMYYASIYRYPLDSMLINEYWSVKDECFSSMVHPGTNKCLVTGEDVLKSRGLEEDSRWINVGIMLGFFVFYRLLSWFVLARKSSKTTL